MTFLVWSWSWRPGVLGSPNLSILTTGAVIGS